MSEKKVKNFLSSAYHRFAKRGISGITASSRVLPNFIIIGTVRSGSTSLYYNICEHPSILSADYDEIGFFDSNYQLGINWYRSMFPTQKKMAELKEKTGFAITGEDTPFYFWKKEAAKRVLEDLPDVKAVEIMNASVALAFGTACLHTHSCAASLYDHIEASSKRSPATNFICKIEEGRKFCGREEEMWERKKRKK